MCDEVVGGARAARISIEFLAGLMYRCRDRRPCPSSPRRCRTPPVLSGFVPTVAEFFAGIGLVRAGVESAGFDVVWANDISPIKHAVYATNFDADDYRLCDVRDVRGSELPAVDVATASFPCIDLSLAGHRRGLAGEQSGLFFEFTRVLTEMGQRKPRAVLIENVPSFMSSRGGRDLRGALKVLNELGYACDLSVVDSRWFVPQSRSRLFVLGVRGALVPPVALPPPKVRVEPREAAGHRDVLRPPALRRFLAANSDLALATLTDGEPPPVLSRLSDVVERLAEHDERWWRGQREAAFNATLPERHRARLAELAAHGGTAWRTAYRRTRGGKAVWEIRSDEIAGCLRTARGGSSRQALVEFREGRHRARWMTAREYGRLQGVGDDFGISAVSEAQALFGFGDAVTVPAVEWLAQNFLKPALSGMPIAEAFASPIVLTLREKAAEPMSAVDHDVESRKDPVASMARRPSSSRIGTFSSLARSSLA